MGRIPPNLLRRRLWAEIGMPWPEFWLTIDGTDIPAICQTV